MASNEPIERLYVKIEADVKDLLTEGEKAIKKLERKMDDLDNKGKKVGRFTKLKAGLDGLVRKLRAAQLAFAAFGAAIVAAFRLAQEAVTDLRVERSFFRLAAAAEQSGNAILAAMRRASQGAVADLTLMQQANLAMQLGVAKTPEEFEKLTSSAIALGAAVGRGPVEAINDLIIAAGRRSRLVLDNLGISLGEVNRLMDEFARVEFGKTVDQLSQIQRDMLFTRATIEAANRKAAQLGGTVEDAGTDIATMTAQAENFKTELGKTSLVLVSLLNQMGEGPGLLKRLRDGAEAWQMTLVQIAALVQTIVDWLKQAVENYIKLASVAGTLANMPLPQLMQYIKSGEFGEDMDTLADEMRFSFGENLEENYRGLLNKFQDVLDPEGAAEGLGVIPSPEIDPEPTEEGADEIKDILRDLTTDMLDEARDRQNALEALEEDHANRMSEINKALADRIADINADLQSDLADLARDTAQERADIMRETRRDLAEVARDTNEQLSDERRDFQKDERRETEDHLRDMRRLTNQYLFDLEDAVRARDARAVVDLQRRFAMESQRREEDFTVDQRREREDFSVRLQEIRENEARRREEILRSQAEALADLVRNEAERRAEIERSHAEQIARAEANATRLRAKEQQNYTERQADLEMALDERLATIARELADEEKVNAEGARKILGALSRYFGRGGKIDKLMDDFERRRTQRMVIKIGFEQGPQISGGTTLPPGAGARIPSFQHGGTLIARKPTLALFGEAGPEVAQFTPLGQGGGGVPQKLQIEFTGSAPPGIRATERDQIAGVLLNALRDTGMLSR